MIRIGVAGWDYADWNGTVYPTRRGSGFDRLRYLAGFVDAIEVNVTFYRPIAPRTAASWLERTADLERFRFTAKAHRSWTHEPASAIDDAAGATLEGLAPLRDAGRLGALLLQFPQSFHNDDDAWERLERLAEIGGGWPLVAEVRHASWEGEEVAGRFERLGLGWCAVDQPVAGGSTLGLLPRAHAPCGYLRLHGRNVDDWFRADAGRDARYDYLYDGAQLREVASHVRTMAGETAEVYVVQNNHFRGQALANALQLRRLIEKRAPAAPRQLVATYPELQDAVAPEEDRLF